MLHCSIDLTIGWVSTCVKIYVSRVCIAKERKTLRGGVGWLLVSAFTPVSQKQRAGSVGFARAGAFENAKSGAALSW